MSAIPHSALNCTIQMYEVEAQAIPFTVFPLPPHLGVEGVFRKEDELNSIKKTLNRSNSKGGYNLCQIGLNIK